VLKYFHSNPRFSFLFAKVNFQSDMKEEIQEKLKYSFQNIRKIQEFGKSIISPEAQIETHPTCRNVDTVDLVIITSSVCSENVCTLPIRNASG
jgi:hypothetical protein